MRTFYFTLTAASAIAALFSAACSSNPKPPSGAPVAAPSPRPSPPVSPPTVATFERGITPRQAPPLPAVPLVEGPLAPKTVFPEPNQAISVRDSNFIFGSVGNGHATLTINGTTVPVAPNGTFMAYLPVPPASAPRYELVARNGADEARTVVPVRVPPARVDLPLDGRLVVDTSSATPRGSTNLILRDNEPVRVSVRAPLNAAAWVTAGGRAFPLANTGGNTFATDISYADLKAGGTLYIARGADTVRFALARPTPTAQRPSQYVMLGDTAAQRDTDATVIGRDIPAGT